MYVYVNLKAVNNKPDYLNFSIKIITKEKI